MTARPVLAALLAAVAACQAPPPPDPLPSWNEGATKARITEFVEAVTDATGPLAVPPAERIAVFDNDGTLWAEQPMYFQLAFVMDRVRTLAPRQPAWARTAPFSIVLGTDTAALATLTVPDLLEMVAATHAGMPADTFRNVVTEWLATARHPRFSRPYVDLAYRPMLELLAYLRANGFKTYIVSGGGVDFLRAFAEALYGIPPEQVVGSMGETTFEIRDGQPVLVKQPGLHFLDDGPGKPVGIDRFIGRRPIAAFGNSDGDLQMLQYTAAGDGPRLMVYVHHDDAAREWAYDRASAIGHLDKGLDEAERRGWTVVSMRDDWRRVFAFE